MGEWFHASEVKIMLASIVAALAVYQAGLMLVGYRKVSLSVLAPVAASRAHRFIGDALVVVTLFVAALCLALFEIEDDTALHAGFATALLVVLGIKIAVVRGRLRGGRWLPLIGTAVLLLFAATWASSAARHLL